LNWRTHALEGANIRASAVRGQEEKEGRQVFFVQVGVAAGGDCNHGTAVLAFRGNGQQYVTERRTSTNSYVLLQVGDVSQPCVSFPAFGVIWSSYSGLLIVFKTEV
jgi:dihydroxyacetone kinase